MGAPMLDMPEGAASSQVPGAAVAGLQLTPLEEALTGCCRRWLLQAHCLLSAHDRVQNGSAHSCPGHSMLPPQHKPLGTAVHNCDLTIDAAQRSQTPPPRASLQAASNLTRTVQAGISAQRAQHDGNSKANLSTSSLLELYVRSLTAAVSAFVELSESSQWHVPPHHDRTAHTQHTSYTPLKRNWRTATLSQYTWTQILESGVLIKTGQVLELFRAPYLYTGPIHKTVHTTASSSSVQLHVRELHETVLHAYSIFISGISLAPVHLWRVLLKQMLEPQANGFLLLLTDSVHALVQTAQVQPRLFAVSNGPGDTTNPASSQPQLPTQEQQYLATRFSSPPLSPSRTGSQQSQVPNGMQLTHVPVCSAGVSMHAGMLHTNQPADARSPRPPSPLRPSTCLKIPPLLLTATPCGTSPRSPFPAMSNAQGAAAAMAATAMTFPAPALQLDALDDTSSFHSHISRSAAVWLLHVLRDINELGTKELSLRRAGVSGPRGLTCVREFLDSLVDLRAGLAGALHELNTLGRFADIYRSSTEVGVTREDLLPLLEGLVAVACTSCSPDLPLPGDNHGRRGQETGDVRLYSTALQGHVVELLTQQLHEALHGGLKDQLSLYADRPMRQLPAALQAQLRLLLRLCECMITLGGASLPAHHTPHMSDMLATRNSSAVQTSQHTRPSSSKSSFSTHSIVRSMSRSHLGMADSLSDVNESSSDGDGCADDDVSAAGCHKQRRKAPCSPLAALVHDLLDAIRIFCQFAWADAPFCATSADSWLPTLKTLARRLACEGHADLVHDITVTLCDAATSMTTAMRRAAAAAAQADEQAQKKAIAGLKRRLAVGLGIAGDMQAVVLARVGKRRCHPERPYGWGAGAMDPDAVDTDQGHGPTAATILAFDAATGIARPLSAGMSRHSNDFLDPVALSSPCVTPRGVRSGIASLMCPSFRSNDSMPRTPCSAADDGNGSLKKKSPFAAVWEALGYNSHGEPMNGDDDGDSSDNDDAEGQPAWPGLPRQCVMHYEQVLQNVLQALLQLTRGFLLPLHWCVLPDAGPSPGCCSTPSHSSSARPSKQRPISGSTKQPHCIAAVPSSPFGVNNKPLSSASFSHRPSQRKSLLMAGGGTSPMAAALLGPRLFQPGSDTSLSETDTTGDTPPGLLPLYSRMVRSGLLQTLESLFTIELLSDQLYRSHAAAVDVSLRGTAQVNGRGASQMDGVRLTATQLLRDVFTNCPQLAADRQGTGALTAVRKFLTLQLHVSAPTTSVHPLAHFTNHANTLAAELARTLQTASGTHIPTHTVPFSSCGLPTHMHGHTTMPQQPEAVQHVSGSINSGLGSDAHDVHVLTSYCVTSLMAISLELLPVPRLVAIRATHDYEPGSSPPGTPGWAPNPNTVLAAGLTLLHTWPPVLSLLLSLFNTVSLQYSSCKAAMTTSSQQPHTHGADTKQTHHLHVDTKAPLQPHSPLRLSPKPQYSLPLSPSVRTQHGAGLAATGHELHAGSGIKTPSTLRSPAAPHSAAAPHLQAAAGHPSPASPHTRPKAGHVTQHGLALVTRLLPRLRQLLEAWLQQACQLQQLHVHMEVLQSCFDMALVHGGAPRLIEGILMGRHFSLATRAQQPSDVDNSRPPFSRMSTMSCQSQCNSRDITRHFKLSGLSLVPLEELLAMLHQMVSPRTALQLVNTQLLPTLTSIVVELHDIHLEAAQASRRLSPRRSSVYYRAASPARDLCRSPSMQRKPSQLPAHDDSSKEGMSSCMPSDCIGQDGDQPSTAVALQGTEQQVAHHRPLSASMTKVKSRNRPTVVLSLPEGCVADSNATQSPGSTSIARSASISPDRADRGSAFAQRDTLQSFQNSMGARSQAHNGLASCVMDRAGHWVLCCSSIVKRVAAGVAVATAQLATARLGLLSVAAGAEKYTAGQSTADVAASQAPSASRNIGAVRGTATGTSTGRPGMHNSSRFPASPNQAATTAAMVAVGQLGGLSMQALLQHCRAVLISCKSSGGVGVEITQALATLPGVLDVAAQLRTMDVTLLNMSEDAMTTSRTIGADIAASLSTFLNGTAGSRVARTPRHTQPESQLRPSLQPQQIPARKAIPSSLPSALVPAEDSVINMAKGAENTPLDAAAKPSPKASSLLKSGHSMLRSRASTLRIQLPTDSSTSSSDENDPDSMSESSESSDGGHGNVRSERQQQGGLMGAGDVVQEPSRISVLVCANPADTLWLQEERIQQQKHHLQRATQLLGHANSAVCQLPTPHVCTAVAALTERPYLLGCCNLSCINNVPGGREHDVVLRRCEHCQRIWYCCEQCKIDDWPQHMLACHFSAALLGRG